MFRRHETEIVIVGAGPVGLAAALFMAQRGVDIRIVDEQWRSATHSYAATLHPETLRLFDQIGVASELIDHGLRIERLDFYDASAPRANIDFGQLRTPFPFVLTIPQSLLENIFERRLRAMGIHVDWSHRLARWEDDETSVTATIERIVKDASGYAVPHASWVVDKAIRLRCRYLLGVDGHHSLVRRQLDIPQKDMAPLRSFAVFESLCAQDLGHSARVVLGEPSQSVLWPLPENRCRWSFETGDSGEEPSHRRKSRIPGAAVDATLTPAELDRLLSERAPWFEYPSLSEITWSTQVVFRACLAQRFGINRVWLAGDAARTAFPVATQGMNVGFLEAHELAWRLTRILRANGDAGLLATYDTECRKRWNSLLGQTAALRPNPSADPWVAERAQAILPCLPASGDDLKALAAQLELNWEAET